MKYALIIPDGAADEPVKELDGRTPFQAAHIPHTDWMAGHGRVGTVVTVPSGFSPASDVATLSLIGYDPAEFYTGRAPLEAAAKNLRVGSGDLVFRCNLTTIIDGCMIDFSAGHIDQSAAETLIAELNRSLADDRVRFHPGIMYRHLMILKDAAPMEITCTPPHDIPNQPIAGHLPRGQDADRINELMQRAGEILKNHEVNRKRQESGQSQATDIWLWGQGQMPQFPAFESRFGLRGACITAVDLIRGISKLVDWQVLGVEGATGYLDTNYAAKGRRAVEALDEFDLICVHIEAPDEAGHNGDAAAKIRAIEQIDKHIVGPILDKLRSRDDWRCLLLPDHPTPVNRRTHTSTPPPFCLAGSNIGPAAGVSFDEIHAGHSGLHIDPGHKLMDYFLGT